MRFIETRQFRFQLLLGGLLTALVVVADLGGLLSFLENKLYDLRCRHCQFFLKPPVPPVHVDIDEAALQAIEGSWPWPRRTTAVIVDELYAAGAKAVALDILFQDVKPGEDDVLAQSLAAPGTVMAVLLGSPSGDLAASKRWQHCHAELLKNLELSSDAARRIVGAGDSPSAGQADRFENEFVTARKEAMFRRITAELAAGLSDRAAVRARLLPATAAEATADELPLIRVFNDQFDLANRVRAMDHFMRDRPAAAPPAFPKSNQTPPSLPLAMSVPGCGFANYDPDADGVVRAVPLWLEVDGRMLPQLGLAAICMTAGVRPQDVRIAPDRVTIPRAAPLRDIVLPVRPHAFAQGQGVAYCMNVPIIGGRDWQSMYDVPLAGGQNAQSLTHISALAAFRVAQTRTRLRNNQVVADAALRDVLNITDPPAGDDYVSLVEHLRPRDAMIEKAMAEIPEKLEQLKAIGPVDATVAATIRRLGNAGSALKRYPAVARDLQSQLDQQRGALSNYVKGRTVFVGWAADGQVDMVPTPLHQRCPGVVVHGAVFNAAMSGELWRVAPEWYGIAITIAFGLLATVAVARLSPARALACVLGALAVYAVINGVVLFDYGNLIVGHAAPLVVAGTVWSSLTLGRIISEIGERARITRRFQSYVDPNLVKYVIDHPELARLEGEEREMTIVFTDLVGFTSMTEQLREKAVKILGRYMSRMVPTIRKHGGLVHTFMGDGIMFSYGAPIENPKHAAAAVATVLEMQVELADFNRALVAEGYGALGMRGGVMTGLVIVGDSGPEDGSDYTCLGNTTNMAARLESANKAFGTRNLISQRTVDLLAGEFLVRPIGRLVVAGKTEGVMVYEPLCAAAAGTDEQRQLADATAEMFDHFVAGRFAECAAAIDRLESIAGPSKLADVYREMCGRYMAEPPAEFHGLIVLREK